MKDIRPEIFFWSAVVLSLSLFFGGGTPAVVADDNLASVASTTPSPYDALMLEAQAVIVYDVPLHRVLFAKNADATLPLASVAKVMTALTALSLIPETTLIKISTDAIKQEGDSKFFVSEEWVLRDLLRFMLLESSNDAAYAVAENAGAVATSTEDRAVGRRFFIEAMNTKAVALGLSATHFENETGLDIEDVETKVALRATAVSTARETALFFAEALTRFPAIFTATSLNELSVSGANGAMRDAKNTNKDTDKLPLLLASKTGFTDLAGGNLVIAFDADFGHPVVVVVLGSTEDGRFTDVEQLVWATLHSFSQ